MPTLRSKVRSVSPGAASVRVTLWSSAAVYWLSPEDKALEERLQEALRTGESVMVSYEPETARLTAAD